MEESKMSEKSIMTRRNVVHMKTKTQNFHELNKTE